MVSFFPVGLIKHLRASGRKGKEKRYTILPRCNRMSVTVYQSYARYKLSNPFTAL